MTDAQLLRYTHALKQYQSARGRDADRYWQAMLLLCTATFTLWERVAPALDMEGGVVSLDLLQEKECLNSSEAGLLTLARNIYNQAVPVNIAALADTLDEECWPVVMEALAIYRREK